MAQFSLLYRLTIDKVGVRYTTGSVDQCDRFMPSSQHQNLMKHYRGGPNIPTSVLYAVMIIIPPIVSCPQMIVTSVVAALTNRLPTGHLGDNFGGGGVCTVRRGHQPLS